MKCDECQEDIVGTYFEREGKNICEKDYQVSLSLSYRNSSYSLFREKSVIVVNCCCCFVTLQKYRKKCSECQEFISGSYYTTKDDKFICAKDYKVTLACNSPALNSPSSSSAAAAAAARVQQLPFAFLVFGKPWMV